MDSFRILLRYGLNNLGLAWVVFLPTLWRQVVNMRSFLPLLTNFSRIHPIASNKLHSSRWQMSHKLVDEFKAFEGLCFSFIESLRCSCPDYRVGRLPCRKITVSEAGSYCIFAAQVAPRTTYWPRASRSASLNSLVSLSILKPECFQSLSMFTRA